MSAMALGFAVAACESGETGVIADPAFEGVEWVQRGVLVEYQVMVEGVRSSTLRADTLYSFGPNGQDSTVVVGMRLQIFEGSGMERANITASTGWIGPRDEMVARGNAVLTIPAEGRRVASDTLFFDPTGQGSVRSDLFTRMIDSDKTICGTGFVSDLSFSNIQIFNPLSGEAACNR